jgi:hypothetical protein
VLELVPPERGPRAPSLREHAPISEVLRPVYLQPIQITACGHGSARQSSPVVLTRPFGCSAGLRSSASTDAINAATGDLTESAPRMVIWLETVDPPEEAVPTLPGDS